MKKIFLMLIVLFSGLQIGNIHASYIEPRTIMGEGGELNMVSFPSNAVTPSPLIALNHQFHSAFDLERNSHDGYQNNNIQLKKDGNTLTIINSTPRVFSRIAFTDGKDGFVIASSLGAFQELTLQITGNLTGDTLYFLDPNPQYAYSVRRFYENLNEDHIKAYQVINSGVKEYFKQISTRDDFFINLDTLNNSEQEKLSKWFRTVTFDTPVNHRILVNSAAGVATLGAGWLSINWPINSYISVGGNYPYAYAIYTHEAAHTMKYPHGSGLAYGLDTYVQNGIAKLLRDGDLVPFEMVNEDSHFYSFLNPSNNSIAFYYDAVNSNDSLTSIDITGNSEILSNSFSNGNRIFFRGDIYSSSKVVVGMLTNSGKLYHGIHTVGSIRELRYRLDQQTILPLEQWSENYSPKTITGDSSVYFYIPPLNSVLETDAIREEGRAIWSGAAGDTHILVEAIGDDGIKYSVPLIGNKLGINEMVMHDGVSKGRGQVRVKLDTSSEYYAQLPYGQNYRATLVLKAASWHDNTEFPEGIVVPVAIYKADPNDVAVSEFVIYDGIDRLGNSVTIRSDFATMGSWNDRMSSWALPKGWVVRFYEEENFRGNYYSRTASGNADSFNKKISSIQIIKRPEALVIYDNINYQGNGRVITADTVTLGNWNDRMSSWVIPEGWEVRFYEGTNFTGNYYSRNKSGNATGFSNVVKSIQIIQRPEKLVIYDESGYEGSVLSIAANMPNLGDWDNRMSSFLIPEGWEVRFYQNPNYQGGFYTYTTSGNASGFSNIVSSIQILRRPEKITIFDQRDFEGDALTITGDMRSLNDWDNRMSSWSIPEGWQVRFYEHENFKGNYYTYDESNNANGFENRVSSIQILRRQ